MKDRAKKRKRVLSDHKKVGSQYIPSFRAVPPYDPGSDRFVLIDWVHSIVPEIIWAGLLHYGWNDTRTCTALVEIMKACRNAPVKGQARNLHMFISDFEGMSVEEKQAIRDRLSACGLFQDVSRFLLPLVALYPECPLSFMIDERVREEGIQVGEALSLMRHVTGEMIEERDRFSAIAQTILVVSAHLGNELPIVGGLSHFLKIGLYPDNEEAQSAAQNARVYLRTFVGGGRGRRQWPGYFWDQGYRIDSCMPPDLSSDKGDMGQGFTPDIRLSPLIESYSENVLRNVFK